MITRKRIPVIKRTRIDSLRRLKGKLRVMQGTQVSGQLQKDLKSEFLEAVQIRLCPA